METPNTPNLTAYEQKVASYALIAADLVRELFRESWMDDEDWAIWCTAVLEAGETSYEAMGQQLALGEAAGIPVDEQLAAVRAAILQEQASQPQRVIRGAQQA